MADQSIQPFMLKTALKLGPVVVFFVAYLRGSRTRSFYQLAGADYGGFTLSRQASFPLDAGPRHCGS